MIRIIYFALVFMWSRDSPVGIVTGLDGHGSVQGQGKETSLFSKRSDRLWDPPSVLYRGYWGIFPRWKSGQGVKLTTHFQLVPTSRMVELYLHSPIRFHGVCIIN
jgi:hypothetical protein